MSEKSEMSETDKTWFAWRAAATRAQMKQRIAVKARTEAEEAWSFAMDSYAAWMEAVGQQKIEQAKGGGK